MRSRGRGHREAAAAAPAESASRRLAEVVLAVIALVVVTYFLSRVDVILSPGEGVLAYPTLCLVGLLAMFALITLLCARRRFGNLYRIVREYWLVFACSGLLAVAGLVWSLMPGAYREPFYIMLYPFNFVVLLGAALLPTSRLFRRNWRYALLVPYVILVAALIYAAVAPEGFGDRGGRATGFLANPNVAAFGVALLTAALLRPRRIDIFSVALLCLSGVAIFVTLSRGGMIYLGALLVFYLWTVRLSFNPRNLALTGIAIGLGLVGVLYGAKPLLERAHLRESRLAMFTLQSDPLEDSSATKRISLFVQTVDRIKEAPILGHGTEATRWDPLGPHNMYLAIWAELGLTGIVLYVLFLVAGYRLFAERQFFSGQAVLLVIVLDGLFSHNTLEHKELFVLYGILMGISWYESRQPRERVRLSESVRRRKHARAAHGSRSGRSSGSAPATARSPAGEAGTPGVPA